jgi:hypothetical protein
LLNCLSPRGGSASSRENLPAPIAAKSAATTPPTSNPSGDSSLPDASPAEGFSTFSHEKQREILQRFEAKYGMDPELGALLSLRRAIQGLSADQTASLIENLYQSPRNSDDGALRSTLASRLAALDPQRTLEIGKRFGSSVILRAALSEIAHRDGAEALRAEISLPPELKKNPFMGFFMTETNLSPTGGSFQEMAAVLHENPSFVDDLLVSGSVGNFLGPALAQIALASPETALAQARDFFDKIEPRYVGLRRSIYSNTLSQMRSQSPEAASAFFDALPETDRTREMCRDEAVARFQRQGVDAAVSFAEKQTNDSSMRFAALGIWERLATQDRSAALAWIEVLPKGPFREGVFSALKVDVEQSRALGSEPAAVEAGMSLPSKAVRLDYFTYILSNRPGIPGGLGFSANFSKIDLVSALPLPETEKIELLRRLAPIQ